MVGRAARSLVAPGLYDEPLTRALEAAIASVDTRALTDELDPEHAALTLSRLLQARIMAALQSLCSRFA